MRPAATLFSCVWLLAAGCTDLGERTPFPRSDAGPIDAAEASDAADEEADAGESADAAE
jgi:hypothetical protein